jgi:hypothetical protein
VILPEAEHFSGGRYKWVNWLDQPAMLPPDVADDLSRLSSSTSYSGSNLPDTNTILQGVPEANVVTRCFGSLADCGASSEIMPKEQLQF